MWVTVTLIGLMGAVPAEVTPTTWIQDCVIVGEVSNTAGEISANLFSNCPLAIEQTAGVLIMKGHYSEVEVLLPENPGVHDFLYRWGEGTAQIDSQDVAIAFGPARET